MPLPAVGVVGVDLGVQSWRVRSRPGGSGPASAGAGCGRGIAAAGDGLRRRRPSRGDGYHVGAVPDRLRVTGVFSPAGDLAGRFAPRLRGGIFVFVCGGCSGGRPMAGHTAPYRDLRRLHLPGELNAQFHCRKQGHDLGHSGRQGRLHEGPFPVHGSDYRSPDRGIFLSQALRPARAPGIPAQHTVNRRRAPARGLLAGHNLDCAGQPDLRDLLSTRPRRLRAGRVPAARRPAGGTRRAGTHNQHPGRRGRAAGNDRLTQARRRAAAGRPVTTVILGRPAGGGRSPSTRQPDAALVAARAIGQHRRTDCSSCSSGCQRRRLHGIATPS